MKSKMIEHQLPDGYTARPTTLDDVTEVAELLNTCSMERIGAPEWNEAELRSDWQSPHFNLEADTCGVWEPAGRLVGYADVWDEAPHVCIYSMGHVLPDHRNRGVGAAMETWLDARARRSIPQAPADARVAITQFTVTTDKSARGFLEAHGYEPVRYSNRMVIDLNGSPPKPDVPDGLRIRTFRGDDELELVVLAVREAFRDHWGYVESPLEESLMEWRHWIETDPEHDPSLWFLAVDGDEIAGISLCRPSVVSDPEMGWVNTLGVRRPWRRRGLALALLQHSIREFHQRGQERVGLGVDASSLTGATRLYEKAGMRVQWQFVRYEKTLRPGEVIATQSLE